MEKIILLDLVGIVRKIETFKQRYGVYPNAILVNEKDNKLLQVIGKASSPGVTELKTVEGMKIIIASVDSPRVGILYDNCDA